jgi:hypothetical protein
MLAFLVFGFVSSSAFADELAWVVPPIDLLHSTVTLETLDHKTYTFSVSSEVSDFFFSRMYGVTEIRFAGPIDGNGRTLPGKPIAYVKANGKECSATDWHEGKMQKLATR